MSKVIDYHEKHKSHWRWQEGDITATRTTMWTGPDCHDGCGVIYYTKDNKVVGIEGDVNNPVNQGRLCMRCLNYPESVNHPDRLKWPLKRIWERGENNLNKTRNNIGETAKILGYSKSTLYRRIKNYNIKFNDRG